MYGLCTVLLLHVLAWPGQNVLGIINGINVPKDCMPYMASVRKEGKHQCGGFLISKDFVVTAARCDVFLSDVRKASVVLGTCHLDTVAKTEKYIVKTCKHPSYTHFPKGNDIMLLKVAGRDEPTVTVRAVPLPTSEFNINENVDCHVAGWGWNKAAGHIVNDLSVSVCVPVINYQDCKRELPHLPANVICGGTGFCKGDFGGPLVCNGRAVGVASYIKGGVCGNANIYTDIFKFLQWINNILETQDC